MADLDRALIDTDGDHDNVALAQLGAAVILAWPLLDSDLQRDLIATAAVVDGVKRDPSFEEILTRLILIAVGVTLLEENGQGVRACDACDALFSAAKCQRRPTALQYTRRDCGPSCAALPASRVAAARAGGSKAAVRWGQRPGPDRYPSGSASGSRKTETTRDWCSLGLGA
jgi:hypothetical protein